MKWPMRRWTAALCKKVQRSKNRIKGWVFPVLDYIWPILEKESTEDRGRRIRRQKKIERAIKNANWEPDAELAISEAYRIINDDSRRAEKVETRAYQLLLLFSVLVPVAASLFYYSDFEEATVFVKTIGLLPFMYGLRALFWALKTINATSYIRIGPSDLAKNWKGEDRRSKLVQDLLISTLYNENSVNKKVSYSILALKFMQRSVLAATMFALVVLVERGCPGWFEALLTGIEGVWAEYVADHSRN